MDNLDQMKIVNPITESDKAWNIWIKSLDAHQVALAVLRETSEAVDKTFNEYVKLRG